MRVLYTSVPCVSTTFAAESEHATGLTSIAGVVCSVSKGAVEGLLEDVEEASGESVCVKTSATRHACA
jgi:hypothetical protein